MRIENELDKSSLFAGKKVFKNAKQFLNACQTLANNHQNQCVGKIVALLQAFGLSMSFLMCCNVRWVSLICVGEKNKINSFKFALYCQKTKSFLFYYLS